MQQNRKETVLRGRIGGGCRKPMRPGEKIAYEVTICFGRGIVKEEIFFPILYYYSKIGIIFLRYMLRRI
jgi:hypothetical protein